MTSRGFTSQKVSILDASRCHVARGVVVHQEIGPRNEAQQVFTLAAQVKRHAAFVGIEREKESAFLRIEHVRQGMAHANALDRR